MKRTTINGLLLSISVVSVLIFRPAQIVAASKQSVSNHGRSCYLDATGLWICTEIQNEAPTPVPQIEPVPQEPENEPTAEPAPQPSIEPETQPEQEPPDNTEMCNLLAELKNQATAAASEYLSMGDYWTSRAENARNEREAQQYEATANSYYQLAAGQYAIAEAYGEQMANAGCYASG